MTGEVGVVEESSPPSLTFTVPGIAVPQGSKRAMLHKNSGRVVMFDDNPDRLRTWRSDVIVYAKSAIHHQRWELIASGAVSVYLSFHLPRPKSRPKKDRYPDRKPDVDKLARACLDALDIAGVFQDDAQVCLLTLAKVYVQEGEQPATHIAVQRVP